MHTYIQTHTRTHTHAHTHAQTHTRARTHTHTHIYIYIYIYIERERERGREIPQSVFNFSIYNILTPTQTVLIFHAYSLFLAGQAFIGLQC